MNKETYSWQEAILYSHKMAQLTKAIWKSIEKDWQEWIKPFDLNLNEHHVLWIAYHLRGATVSEISKFGVMHVSTAFNFSKKLEKRGLLTFSKKEEDKRNTYVKLTEEGVRLFEETMAEHDPEKNSVMQASLPLKSIYGSFPEFQELESIVKHLYGDEYLEILDRSLESIRKEY
ncbi:HTH-type transcriptional regulator Hpr [Filobacillus milosensis]|uniref:HTH-type transcriptional regulator Hpr n=1 Tax=Filobacillus milosensis TaxID=94137 RepID=A0A4Y8INY3_9BACI|nr:HTH-type transcriptional regulator Hpr [Filobacillus milosensis]TFB22094.1 HTH-type transcriptional regulator Hpr [Filobacillus milosensis]